MGEGMQKIPHKVISPEQFEALRPTDDGFVDCPAGDYSLIGELHRPCFDPTRHTMVFESGCYLGGTRRVRLGVVFHGASVVGEFVSFGGRASFTGSSTVGRGAVFHGDVRAAQAMRFGDDCVFIAGGVFGDHVSFGREARFHDESVFGDGCKFGTGSEFGAGCKFGRGCEFAEGCEFAPGCSFSAGCAFSAGCGFAGVSTFRAGCTFGGRSPVDHRRPYISIGRVALVNTEANYFLLDDDVYVKAGAFWGAGGSFVRHLALKKNVTPLVIREAELALAFAHAVRDSMT